MYLMNIEGQDMETHQIFVIPIGNEKNHRKNRVSPKRISAKISSKGGFG